MPVTQEQIDRITAQMPELGRDPASVRRRVEALEQLLESGFTMPVIGRRFGLDFLLGLVPVVGDVMTAAMGAWIIWEARNLGMSRWQIGRMMANLGVDTVLGAVPLLGDAFDFMFRSNTRNLRIIKRHLDRHYPETRPIEGKVVGRRVVERERVELKR